MWLYLPSTISPSAPASECSTKASDLHASILASASELPVTSKGKLLRPASLQRLWKRGALTRLRSGLTSPPSTLDRGVAEFIASLPASPASPTASPESAKGSRTNDGSGPRLTGLLATLDPSSSGWKTSQVSLLPEDSTPSSPILPAEGTARNGRAYLRLPLEVRISASGFSSSPGWPTTTTSDAKASGAADYSTASGRHSGTTLTDAINRWPTPDANQYAGSNRSPSEGAATRPALVMATQQWKTPHGMSGLDHTGKVGGGGEFAKQATHWATPNAHDGRRPGADLKSTQGANLNRDASMWQTPKASEEESGSGMNSRGEPKLKAQAQMWASPRASESEKGGPNQRGGKGDPILSGQAAQWPTPMAADQRGSAGVDKIELPNIVMTWPTPAARMHKGGGTTVTRKDGKSRMDMLDWRAEAFSRPDHPTSDGPTSSPSTQASRRRLNPAFACWLMGWPWWWTNPGLTSSAQSAMASWRSLQRRHLSCLLGERDASP
jgi:hypothetical protein